jgi:3-phosphoshikimate 1-carboxyvinyltransferase
MEPDGTRIIRIRGEAELKPQVIEVPGDPSSAAFFIVAALIVPGSELVIENVGLNPTRAGLVHVLRQMGGQHRGTEPPPCRRRAGGGPAGDGIARSMALRSIPPSPPR